MKNKILLINSDKIELQENSIFLEKEGYNVYTAENVTIGLISAIRVLPDIILSILDSNCNEFHICKALKKIPETSLIPIIFITNTPQEILTGLKLGINGFLIKPYTNEKMLEIINIHI
jgi:PleD family two-component response regulator